MLADVQMKKRNIEAMQAAKYLSAYADLYLDVTKQDWQKLPLSDFYLRNESLFCYIDSYAMGDEVIIDPLAEHVVLKTFFALLKEVEKYPADKELLLLNPDFRWLESSWMTWDKPAMKI
jgi:hypothetical protein